jgi:hypothetical protein
VSSCLIAVAGSKDGIRHVDNGNILDDRCDTSGCNSVVTYCNVAVARCDEF